VSCLAQGQKPVLMIFIRQYSLLLRIDFHPNSGNLSRR
jgi:hypothetical protein